MVHSNRRHPLRVARDEEPILLFYSNRPGHQFDAPRGPYRDPVFPFLQAVDAFIMIIRMNPLQSPLNDAILSGERLVDNIQFVLQFFERLGIVHAELIVDVVHLDVRRIGRPVQTHNRVEEVGANEAKFVHFHSFDLENLNVVDVLPRQSQHIVIRGEFHHGDLGVLETFVIGEAAGVVVHDVQGIVVQQEDLLAFVGHDDHFSVRRPVRGQNIVEEQARGLEVLVFGETPFSDQAVVGHGDKVGFGRVGQDCFEFLRGHCGLNGLGGVFPVPFHKERALLGEHDDIVLFVDV